MIEIFKTNVESAGQATYLTVQLHRYLSVAEINFDLDDCDSILRVKGENFCTLNVIRLLADSGFECCLLE